MLLPPLCALDLETVTVVAAFFGIVVLIVLFILLLYLSTERLETVAEAEALPALALLPLETVLTGELCVKRAQTLLDWPRESAEHAKWAHQLSDEAPQPPAQRETQRRTRVLSLLHQVTETTAVPPDPVVAVRTPPSRPPETAGDETRRRRLRELLRRLAAG